MLVLLFGEADGYIVEQLEQVGVSVSDRRELSSSASKDQRYLLGDGNAALAFRNNGSFRNRAELRLASSRCLCCWCLVAASAAESGCVSRWTDAVRPAVNSPFLRMSAKSLDSSRDTLSRVSIVVPPQGPRAFHRRDPVPAFPHIFAGKAPEIREKVAVVTLAPMRQATCSPFITQSDLTRKPAPARALHKVVHASGGCRTICTKRACSEERRTIVLMRARKMSVDRRDFLRLLTSAAALVATGNDVAEGE